MVGSLGALNFKQLTGENGRWVGWVGEIGWEEEGSMAGCFLLGGRQVQTEPRQLLQLQTSGAAAGRLPSHQSARLGPTACSRRRHKP